MKYNQTDTCDRCRDRGEDTKLSSGKACREKDKEGNETGRWICIRCKSKYYNDIPDSYSNSIKLIADRRTGNQDQNSANAKGDLFQELTCIWRSTVSTVTVEDLNKKLDNYNTPIDHSADSELGILQTKGCLYNSDYRKWSQSFSREYNQIVKGFKFDILILYCASKDGKMIERIYIFPVEEILKRTGISITKNPTDSWGNSTTPWYEKYRIKDEETVKKINEIWKEIIDKKRS